MQEDSEKTGKVTSAGIYFLHCQVYRMDSSVNAGCFYHIISILYSSVDKNANFLELLT